ncbi:MAG: hybrid sensor histidine kinase/response regulator [Desulfobacterales bacterium]|nr:hybrid sensor histidine kinase/response regulator [Desulfobacterales bacterium]
MNDEKKRLILLVDDNPRNLQVLGNMLKEHGYKLAVAESGAEALEFVRKKRPDLILLDIMMPDMDGFETCASLKKRAESREIPVIFITALTETRDKLKAFEVGGLDYITKPFHHEEVLARVNAHLTIRKLQEDLQEQNRMLNEYAELLEDRNDQLLSVNEKLDSKNLELKEKNVLLNEVNASKDKFFSIMAHDLRGPLGSLHEMTKFIVDKVQYHKKDKLVDMLSVQRDAAKSLFTLLENLLTWSRLQRGMIDYRPHTTNVAAIIAMNINLFTPRAEQKKIFLRNAIEGEMPVYADFNMIDTVIRNLISNALKFTRAGGVNVSVKEEDHSIEIAISDTGIGMSKKMLSKLFRIDSKFKMVGTDGEEGTGLGLILCKEFVEKNGGRIRVESEEGKGATFTVTLPKSNA